MEAMSFLVATKEVRSTVSNCSESIEGDLLDDQEVDNGNEDEESQDRETESHADTTLEEFGPEVIDPSPKAVNKSSATHKKRPRADSADTTSLISEAAKSITKRFSAPQPVESHRMGFFRSILPEVEKLSSSDFIAFQMSVLKSLSHFTEKAHPPEEYQRPLDCSLATSGIRSYPPSEYSTGSTYSPSASPRFSDLMHL